MRRVNFHIKTDITCDMADNDDILVFLGRVSLQSNHMDVYPLDNSFVQWFFLIPFFVGVIVGALAVTIL